MALVRAKAAWVIIAVVAVMGLAACGSDPTATPVPPTATPVPQADPTPTATTDPFLVEWNALIEAAQEEGRLVAIAGPSSADENRPVIEEFGRVFGIDATIEGGPGAELAARVIAERSQGLYTVDIASTGGSATRPLKKAGAFGLLMPQLIHPEALDRSTGWYVDYMPWDTVDYITHISLSVEPNFVSTWYNTETVSDAELAGIESYFDLLDPRWKGRIVIGDVSDGEDLADASNAWLYLGREFLDRLLTEMDPTVIALGGTREYADGLARGDWDIGLFPGGSRNSLENAEELGLPVAQFPRTMKEGAFAGTTRRLGYMDPPAHPNAAKLFLNWILSKEGQTAYQQFNTNPNSLALRSDVPQGSVGDEQWARAQAPELRFEDIDEDANQKARDDVQAYFVAKFKELGITP